jgi:hypothetical protein
VSDTDNALQLVEQSIWLLATDEHRVKHRLLAAYTQRLQYVFPEKVPRELSALLMSIRTRLYREPRYKGQSTVESALYRMRAKAASAIAADILELGRGLRTLR